MATLPNAIVAPMIMLRREVPLATTSRFFLSLIPVLRILVFSSPSRPLPQRTDRNTKPKYVQNNILLGRRAVRAAYFRSVALRGTIMAYPAGHRAEVRKRIIASARRLFNLRGFDNVSLKQIMAGANLTHGGFYSYFKSKSDLYSEVLGCFFTDPNSKNCWKGVHLDLSSTDVGTQVVRAYLSRQHFENVENSCPMAALPSYVARSRKKVK